MEPTMYRILVKGRLTDQLAAAFSGMRVGSFGENTSLTGLIRDQSELYGLLDTIRNLGLELDSAQAHPPRDSPTGIDHAVDPSLQ